MTTRSGDQQKKQRQKEFEEKKEHQKRLLAVKKAERDARKSKEKPGELGESQA
ncbi:hypothetical protein [Adhaeribacter pallidiroseus]|uniref:Uncharacterized protein n=1 Tax=Adhaeribacter pallidiroseus TaxID=2072847 RepID=A0A369QMM2_9BACT|nr:hypothetical protein [Adhaeribacter pallidiroseus]RDC66191.1 hypothetical protein AHMF7616_04822 [Adhaeribacter pallidiroseus]